MDICILIVSYSVATHEGCVHCICSCHWTLFISQHSDQSSPVKKDAELPTPKVVLYPRNQVQIGWKSSTRKWHVGAGMINMGNTCYLNSTLQALFHVPAFANWLVSDMAHRKTCEAKSKYILHLHPLFHSLENSNSNLVHTNLFVRSICSRYSRWMHKLRYGENMPGITAKSASNQTLFSLFEIANGVQTFAAWAARGRPWIPALSHGSDGESIPDSFCE